MISAIYARETVAFELDAATQIELCRRFAQQRGWEVRNSLIFVDHGWYVHRSALDELIASTSSSQHSFGIVLVDDACRLSLKAAGLLSTITTLNNLGVITYFISQNVDSGNTSFVDCLVERTFEEQGITKELSERVHESHSKRARAGYLVGGKTFGYDNVRISSSIKGSRPPVVQRINPEQAEIVRSIYESYIRNKRPADIANELNQRGITAPRPGQWKALTINHVLRNEIYRGSVTWNKRRNVRNREWGCKTYFTRPECEWIRADNPELKIVCDEVWFKVAAIRALKRYPGSKRNAAGEHSELSDLH